MPFRLPWEGNATELQLKIKICLCAQGNLDYFPFNANTFYLQHCLPYAVPSSGKLGERLTSPC